MEQLALGLVIALVLWIASIVLIRERRHRRLEEIGQLSPGPKCWPVVGNIFQLGWSPHAVATLGILSKVFLFHFEKILGHFGLFRVFRDVLINTGRNSKFGRHEVCA